MQIVLYEPEIPQNTGNIVRTCAATQSALHLIKPLGFTLTDKYLKRAGLDFWKHVEIYIHHNYKDFKSKYPNAKIYMASSKAKQSYAQVVYEENSFIMFGPESRGIPEKILIDHQEDCIRIPMSFKARSLNLANSVSIILFESLRQQNFPNLTEYGDLHQLQWKI